VAFRDCNNRADVSVHKIPFVVLAECVNKDNSNPEVVRAKRTPNAVSVIHAVLENISPEDVKDHKILCVQVVENVHPANTRQDRVQEQTTQFAQDAPLHAH
jgi:formaldehyde-activating enzyme involved in methanogenesis